MKDAILEKSSGSPAGGGGLLGVHSVHEVHTVHGARRALGSDGNNGVNGSNAARRLLWLDLFRGLAVLWMIETHVVNTFLRKEILGAGWFGGVHFANGLVAPAFLFASGFLQGVKGKRKAESGKGAMKQLARIGQLLLLAYALHVPWSFDWGWVSTFKQIDVLQCIAISMLIGLGLQRFGRGAVWAGAAFFVFAAPIAAGIDGGSLPGWLAGYVNRQNGSLFPLFPWAGFFLVGVGCGLPGSARVPRAGCGVPPQRTFFPRDLKSATADLERLSEVRFGGTQKPARGTRALPGIPASPWFWVGAALICTGAAWAQQFLPAIYPAHDYYRYGPGFFVERLGWILALGAFCQAMVPGWAPALVMNAGGSSLAVYVLHLQMINLWSGMAERLELPQRLGLADTGAVLLGVVAATLTLTGLLALPRVAPACRWLGVRPASA